MKKIISAASAVLVITLIACGGGGGGNSSDSRVNDYNVNLKSVVFLDGQVSPNFSSDKTSYNIEVSATTTSVEIVPEAADSKAKVTLNGTDITGNSVTVPLEPGLNPLSLKVTAPDNVTVKTYNFSVKRLTGVSGNANLAGIEVSEGVLSPVFSENTVKYNVIVDSDVNTLNVTPVAAGIGAAIKVNGTPVISGNKSQDINLSVGTASISITVTAADNSVKEYIVSVTKYSSTSSPDLAGLSLSSGELSGGFSPDTEPYTAYVLYSISSITVRPTAAWDKSTIKVFYGSSSETVLSGFSSSLIPLSVGSNTIYVEVTTEYNQKKIYTIYVYRIKADDNTLLANLTVSSGKLLFDQEETEYLFTVTSGTNSLTVTPVTAVTTSIVTVNGTIVPSGTASMNIDINSGPNTFSLMVLAENGDNRVYHVKVFKYYQKQAVLSCGYYHTMLVKPDGTLWAAGYNAYGQLGDGSIIDSSTLKQVMTDVASVSTGYNHTMIVKTNGTLWATGRNYSGQLGNGTLTDVKTPVQIMTDVKSVFCGNFNTFIVKNDGTLWATGSNGDYQLGDGSRSSTSIPVYIMDNAESVSASEAHTMILAKDGTLWGTGSNSSGELCDGTTYMNNRPYQVLKNVSRVSAKNYITSFLMNNGTLWQSSSSGNNMIIDDVVYLGSGIGNTSFIGFDNKLYYIGSKIELLAADVNCASSGGDFKIIQKNDGTFWAAGNNTYGQFGNGNNYYSSSFIQLPW